MESVETSETAEEQVERPEVDLIDYLLYPFFLLIFCSTLLIFDPLQRIAFLFGSRAQQRVALWLSYGICLSLKVLGTKIRVQEPSAGFLKGLDADRAYIIVSTHQSLFDISILASIFYRHHPRFVAKEVLGKWIPSVSYNLRAGGAALIDRENPRQAIPELKRFAKYVSEAKCGAVIFPEGTRARDGRLNPLQAAGLTVLLSNAPEAEVIPLILKGTWKLSCRKFGPIPRGLQIDVVITEMSPRSPGDAKLLAQKTIETLSKQFPLV